MLRRHSAGLLAVVVFVAILGFTTPLSADQIPIYNVMQGRLYPNPFGPGFLFDFFAVDKGGLVRHHIAGELFGPTALPSCPNPCMAGSIFDPSVVLTFGSSEVINLTGKSFKIPAGVNPTAFGHVTMIGQLTGQNYTLNFDRGATLVLQFSGSGSNLTLRSEAYILVPEPGTLALFGTGLTFIASLRKRAV